MESSELFLTRDVKDPQFIERCQTILNEWSGRIPFSPIKKLGSETEFIAAIEHATFKTKVTTQIEKRWLEDHEQPYRQEKLPQNPQPKSNFDPWKFDFSPFADFSKHSRSQEILETRHVYECTTCRATGEVTCGECGGLGEVKCSDCNGYGHNECSSCSGSGHIRETRTIPRQTECSMCDGKGYHTFDPFGAGKEERCSQCGGKGSVFKDFEEEYYVPCSDCGSSGKITCDTCRGHGKVTCGECGGSGKVECSRCEGQRRLLSHTTVEVTEEPSSNTSQYIAPTLPKFNKKDNPLSNLKGQTVFTQDETKRIDQFGFQNQPAAAVLSSETNKCRASHDGHILRQRIEIEACSVIEYRYRHQTKQYSIYINPDHRLVEDLEGPIQSAIANMDALAEKAFKEKRYEDAYRLVTRGLCMEETTESEKKLRDQALRALVMSYGKLALLGWLGAAVIWWLVDGAFSNFQISWWFILGLIPLPFGVQWFAQDFGVCFSGSKERVQPAIFLGVISFLSGAGIGAGTSWTDWMGLVSLIIATCIFGLIRSKERALHTKLEAHFATFPSPQALETYVLKLDPKPEPLSRTKLTLTVFAALLVVQPIMNVVSDFNGWALDRTRVQFDLQIGGKPADVFVGTGPVPEVEFNGKSIHSGDKVQPGKGVIEVTDVRFMPFRREIKASYGSIARVGTIELTPAHGQITITSDPPDAEFQLANQAHSWNGNLPFQKDLPTGDYRLVVRRKGWELYSDTSVVRGGSTTNQVEFPYGSIVVTSDPMGLAVSTNGVEIGKTPITLQELKPATYNLTISDGENDLMAEVHVGPKENAKHEFIFRYGKVQLASMPVGATVVRKGKEVGKTPITLEHIPAGESAVELRLDGYATTNVAFVCQADTTASYTVNLVSEQYLSDLSDARNAAAGSPPDYSQAFAKISEALKIYPDDVDALQLQKDYQLGLALREASALLGKGDLDQASAKIEAALVLKPSDYSAIALKQKIADAKARRDQAANAEADRLSDEKAKEAGAVFQQHISNIFDLVRRNPFSMGGQPFAFKTQSWRVHASPAQAETAMLDAAQLCTPVWQMESKAQPLSGATEYHLRQKLLIGSSAKKLEVQICELPNKDVDIRANLVLVILPDNDPNYPAHMRQLGNGYFATFISHFSHALQSNPLAQTPQVNSPNTYEQHHVVTQPGVNYKY